MPLSEETQAEIQAYVLSLIRKVRVPELAPYTLFGELSMDDRIPWWMAEADKTVYVPAQVIRTLLLTGGSQTVEPVLDGDPMIYEVSAADAGGKVAAIPSLAGKTFFLRLEGRPLKPSEYNMLAGGGFELTNEDDELIEGQRFDYQVYHFEGSEPGSPSQSPVLSALFTGKEKVETNKTLSATSAGKLIQLRSGSTPITLTLADISVMPLHSVVVIESSINSDAQNTIAAYGGQYIYMNRGAHTQVIIGAGENIWLYRDTDGYYVIGGAVPQVYKNLAKPYASFEVADDELRCDGQLVSRAAHPRLWAKVQQLGPSIITEAELALAPADKKGCYTYGDGATTFRLPNLNGAVLRGIKPGDSERPYNHPGGWQPYQTEKHNHVTAPYNKAGAKASDVDGQFTPGSTDSNTNQAEYRVGGMDNPKWVQAEIKDFGGSETRSETTGVFWVVKR